jgi:cell division protein FtsL
VCGEGTKYLLVLAQPRVPLRAVMSSRPVMFALLPLGFVLAVLLCAVAGAFTTHLVVSG